MTPVPKLGVKRLILVAWLLIAVVYFYFSVGYIRVDMRDREFRDRLSHVVQLAGTENRPLKDVRAVILGHAKQLGLPIETDQVVIRGAGQTLNVLVDYEVGINVPIIRRNLYRHYVHNVYYRPIN
jgi:hypothetical protein